MFQSTQNFLFRPIAALGHFNIHPPLPLNPRESQQLLNLLKTSFRQQLNREHGPSQSEPDGEAKTSSTGTPRNPSKSKDRRCSQSKPVARSHTDRHLYSILTNPLFNRAQVNSGGVSRSSSDPMDIFDEACSKGFMNIGYAGACLDAKKRIIVQSSALSVKDTMKSCGAGSKVLRWLVSSGVGNKIAFLENRRFSRSIVEFLVAEGLQDVVWTWLNRLFVTISTETTLGSTTSANQTAAHLLCDLVREESSGYISLDVAFASFQKAVDQLEILKCQTRPVLARAGLFLSYESTFQSSSHPAPSPAAYNSFLTLLPKFTNFHDLHLSHLLLHHPDEADAIPALKLLRKVEKEHFDQRTSSREKYPDSRIISIGLDTARHLLEQDKHEDARWVMEFLQNLYAKQLGLHQRRQFEQAQAEISSLELLRGLNLA